MFGFGKKAKRARMKALETRVAMLEQIVSALSFSVGRSTMSYSAPIISRVVERNSSGMITTPLTVGMAGPMAAPGFGVVPGGTTAQSNSLPPMEPRFSSAAPSGPELLK